jgi:predicted Fe-Mo cluster-binding NifX family protein
MRVAMPVRDDRISPVFDTARRLLLIDVEAGAERHRRVTALPRDQLVSTRLRAMRRLKVDVLICGGISRHLMKAVSLERLTLISWVAGPTETVLNAYLEGRLLATRWGMPGCQVRCSRPRTLPAEGFGARAKVYHQREVFPKVEENGGKRRRPWRNIP